MSRRGLLIFHSTCFDSVEFKPWSLDVQDAIQVPIDLDIEDYMLEPLLISIGIAV